MKISNIGVNKVVRTAHGTTVEIGFTFSESDGQEDDQTLDKETIHVPNTRADILLEPFLTEFKDRLSPQLREAID